MRLLSRNLVALLLVGIILPATGQQIRINEIMSSNSAAKADEDGDFSDWIELYNPGPDTVHLQGWGLSDNQGNPFKWTFPEKRINPGQYLLVWASGKNYRPAEGEWVSGIRREVFGDIPGTSVSTLVANPSYPRYPTSCQLIRDYFKAPVNVSNNYGQRMHGYILAPQSGSYTFWISSDDAGQLWLSSDEDTGNSRLIAQVTSGTNPEEWGKYTQQKSAPVTLEKGRYYYISALMKEGTGGDNLAVGWQLPDGTTERPVPGRHLFWTEGELHTNFSISAAGEEIVLTNSRGEKVDELPAVKLTADISYGRLPGNTSSGFFDRPTPGSVNATVSYSEILSPPVFSHPGGFYDAPFSLSLSSSQSGVSFVYTLDGSQPDLNNTSGTSYLYMNQYRKNPGSAGGSFLSRSYRSYLYGSPIEVRDRTSEGNQISGITTTFDASPWYAPSVLIDKAVVVKARAVKEGALASEVVTNTFFVRSGGTNPYPLPVLSFSTQENALFDYYDGIYVAGVDFENWRSANPSATANGGSMANYHREGDQWEYPAHLELFNTAGSRVFAQNIGFRIHGNWSNAQPFKSLRIYARGSYGKQNLEYPFFKTRSDQAFKRIILRNSGNDIWYTMFRDAAMQEMVSHLNFETQAYQPSILFVNGEYWGIHNIRERYDKYYLSRRYGVNEEQLDILENNMVAEEGDNRHYAAMIEYIAANGVQHDQDYAYIQTQMDVSSFIDYMIAQIFMVNTDWPGNNIRFWRLQTPEFLPGAGPGKDGRWRWMLYDADYTFGIYSTSECSKNMLEFTTLATGTSWPNPAWSTFLFRRLLERQSFRTDFIVRFSDELNTAFKPEVVIQLINRMQSVIEPEMGWHIQRWKMPSSLAGWYNNVNVMVNFARQRPAYARNHLRQFFSLQADYQLTVDVSGGNQGHVVVNTIPLLGTTRGVSVNPYPWQGTYFREVPLRLEAVPEEGCEFVRWESGGGTFDQPVLELKPVGDQNFVAVFKRSEQQVSLVPSIIHPSSGATVEGILTVQWTPVNGSQSYELTIADNDAFANPLLSVNNITAPGYEVNLASGDKAYYARVRAVCGLTPGAWSDAVVFHIQATSSPVMAKPEEHLEIYPNPFTEDAALDLYLNRPGMVRIGLYSLSGRKISEIFSGYRPEGIHSFRIHGCDLIRGAYVVFCQTGTTVYRRKVIRN